MSTKWFSDRVTANGIKLHYHRTGGDRPPVVLSHGITDNGRCWTQLAQDLENEYDVIMVDARGHGLSDAPQAVYTYQDMAADLAGLITALDLERPVLIGHSMGAATTVTAASHYPDLMRGVILEDPPWRRDQAQASEEERSTMRQGWQAQVEARKALSREQIIAQCRADNPRWGETEYGPWAESKLQLSLNVFQLMSNPPTPWQELVGRISCPILLISGDPERGAIITPEIAQEAMNTWQTGQVVHIPDAGHCIRRDQPDLYTVVVREFLQTGLS
jgi:pimeloyl-ACP methyl ester carboxylesterase